MFLYGVIIGIGITENKRLAKGLWIFYAVQVPWISSHFIFYKFFSGLELTFGFSEKLFMYSFTLGSDWGFATLQDFPTGIGVNVFALVMMILSIKIQPVAGGDRPR